MDKEAQIEFVNNLTGDIARKFAMLANEGRVPEDWNGHELRTWLALQFEYEQTNVMKDKRKARRRAFDQAMAEFDLW